MIPAFLTQLTLLPSLVSNLMLLPSLLWGRTPVLRPTPTSACSGNR
jgi:hypothetical protein